MEWVIDMARTHSKLTTSALWLAATDLSKTTNSKICRGVRVFKGMFRSKGVAACIAGRGHPEACMADNLMMILGRTQA